MSADRRHVEQQVDRILERVFGLGPGQIDHEQSFAEDLMAESLDYVDIELHVRQAFGIEFDFSAAAEQIRSNGVDRIRVRDLIDFLEPRVAHA